MSEDFFGDLGKSISKATQSAVGKTSTFFESTKIQALISTEQKEIGKLYQKVGELVFRRVESHEDTSVSEEILSYVGEIRVHLGKIRDLKSDLAGVRGMKICPSCLELADPQMAFCPKCGGELPVEEDFEEIELLPDERGDSFSSAAETVPVYENDEPDDMQVIRELERDLNINEEMKKIMFAEFTTIDDVEAGRAEKTQDPDSLTMREEGLPEAADGEAASVFAEEVIESIPGSAEEMASAGNPGAAEEIVSAGGPEAYEQENAGEPTQLTEASDAASFVKNLESLAAQITEARRTAELEARKAEEALMASRAAAEEALRAEQALRAEEELAAKNAAAQQPPEASPEEES